MCSSIYDAVTGDSRKGRFILTGGSCGSQAFFDANPSDFPERTFYNYPRGPLSMLEASVASIVVSRQLFLNRITVGTDVWNPHKGGRQESKTTSTAGDSLVQPDLLTSKANEVLCWPNSLSLRN